MKKLFLVGLIGLLSMGAFAQSWTVDGNFDFRDFRSNNEVVSGESTTFSFTLRAGRYITDRLNVGIRGGFMLPENGSSFNVGPTLKFDFYRINNIYFSLLGEVFYARFIESYWWNANFPANDAHRIAASVMPRINYSINDNITVYWAFAALSFRYDWLTLQNTNIDSTITEFRIAGPFGNPAFGIIFRF